MPIVEPEILMDGDHNMATTAAVQVRFWSFCFSTVRPVLCDHVYVHTFTSRIGSFGILSAALVYNDLWCTSLLSSCLCRRDDFS